MELDLIPPGSPFEVLDGPVCNQNFAWFQVNYDGLVGWTAEANAVEYWLEPIDSDVVAPTASPPPSRCIAVLTGEVSLRDGPGTNFERAGVAADEEFPITAQTTNPSGFVWFRLQNGFYVREDVISLRGDCTGVPRQ